METQIRDWMEADGLLFLPVVFQTRSLNRLLTSVLRIRCNLPSFGRNRKLTEGSANKTTYSVTLRCVRATIVALQKQNITYCECVFVAFVVQHAKGIILSSVACLSQPYFPTLSH
jgi:hypothetical protein